MKQFVVYEPSTGRILRTGACGEAAFKLQARDGEAVIEGLASGLQHYVKDGEIHELPPKPAPWLTFDAATGAWLDLRSPEEVDAASAEAWAALRAERDRRLAASDWTQLPDATVNRDAWAAYRSALRALPEITSDPLSPLWPAPPEG